MDSRQARNPGRFSVHSQKLTPTIRLRITFVTRVWSAMSGMSTQVRRSRKRVLFWRDRGPLHPAKPSEASAVPKTTRKRTFKNKPRRQSLVGLPAGVDQHSFCISLCLSVLCSFAITEVQSGALSLSIRRH